MPPPSTTGPETVGDLTAVRVRASAAAASSRMRSAVPSPSTSNTSPAKSASRTGGPAYSARTAAQAKWSNDEQAILYPSGGWIENEMKSATKSGFEMTGAPEPTVSSSPTMPYASLRAAAGEPYIVPSQANNVAGGKEILRAMLSKAAATNFSKTRLAPTIVKGLVPSDGFGSTALVSQTKMLDAAGSNTFNYQFVDYYGMNTDQLVVWNSFLSGQTDVPGLTKGLQTITDKIANDPSVKKQTVT
jgi:N-acetylglucosamine transport system substrate-binding protein